MGDLDLFQSTRQFTWTLEIQRKFLFKISKNFKNIRQSIMKLLLVLLLQNIKCGKLKVSGPKIMLWLKLSNSETT